MLSVATLGVIFLAFANRARTAPSPGSVGSDLQFLFQNDLNCEYLGGPIASLTKLSFRANSTQS